MIQNLTDHHKMPYLLDGIDFVDAAMSHVEWRHHLKSQIEGSATDVWLPNIVRVNNCCDLGQWLTGIGKSKFSHFSAFHRLEHEHTEFHFYAGLTLTCLLEGNRDEALALLKNEFSQTTRRILIAISEMNEAMMTIHQQAESLTTQS